jgi:hypothetical protein
MARNFTLPIPVSAFIGSRNVVQPASLVNKALPTSYRTGWAFDDTTQEAISCHSFIFPDEYTGTGTLKLEINFSAAGSTGTAAWVANVEAVTPGDTLNLNTSEDFDLGVNSNTAALAGTTAGDLISTTVTLSNKDSVASGDQVRLAIQRLVGSDDASGDLTLWAVSLYEET